MIGLCEVRGLPAIRCAKKRCGLAALLGIIRRRGRFKRIVCGRVGWHNRCRYFACV